MVVHVQKKPKKETVANFPGSSTCGEYSAKGGPNMESITVFRVGSNDQMISPGVKVGFGRLQICAGGLSLPLTVCLVDIPSFSCMFSCRNTICFLLGI